MSSVASRNTQVAAKIEKYGTAIVIPEGMPTRKAADYLSMQADQEDEVVVLVADFDYLAWDGAYHLLPVLEEIYGIALAQAEKSFWGETPPSKITIPISHNQKANVLWGNFEFPYTEGGKLMCDMLPSAYGLPAFRLKAKVKQKFEGQFNAIRDALQKRLEEASIYRNKSLKVNFESGAAPEFLDVTRFDPKRLVYTEEVEALLDMSLHTPIRYPHLTKAAGVPQKRGILLAGPYGTGKTEQAYHCAWLSQDPAHPWTFIYVEDVSQLAMGVAFARRYGRTILYAEDLDRALEERDDAANVIINTVDGIDTKEAEVLIVLTTNHIEKIDPAMLRAGRLDTKIWIGPPDAAAVRRLIRGYAGDLLDAEAICDAAGEILDGEIPASIREAVELSKLAAISRTGSLQFTLTDADLAAGAYAVVQQKKFSERQPADPTPAGELLTRDIVERVTQRVVEQVMERVQHSIY